MTAIDPTVLSHHSIYRPHDRPQVSSARLHHRIERLTIRIVFSAAVVGALTGGGLGFIMGYAVR